MRNSFNFLLIALIFMDSCYLVGSVCDAFRKSFFMATDLHKDMFPYFLFPFHNIAMTGSVFMTVAIAFERYRVVYAPSGVLCRFQAKPLVREKLQGRKLLESESTFSRALKRLKSFSSFSLIHPFSNFSSIFPSRIRILSSLSCISFFRQGPAFRIGTLLGSKKRLDFNQTDGIFLFWTLLFVKDERKVGKWNEKKERPKRDETLNKFYSYLAKVVCIRSDLKSEIYDDVPMQKDWNDLKDGS